MSPRHPRSLAIFLALSLASAPLSALAQPAAALVEIAAGDKATRSKDYAGALGHYQSANLASPSLRALMGVADAFYGLGRPGEAYEAYNDAQTTYAGKLGPVEKALVAKRLKELSAVTGWLSIRIAEPGAQVELDGKPVGVSPVPVLIRVTSGGHDVRVTKAGFGAFSGHADVAVEGTAIVEVKLAAAASQGHIVVHSAGPEPLRVIVDGVDVGVTPWEGDLAPGTHTIAGKSATAQAEAQTVELQAGSHAAVDLVSSATAAHIQIRTNDGKGSIFVDGIVRGEGAFSGDVAPGPHTVVVTRDGFQRYEKSMALGERQTWAETVTLSQGAATGGEVIEGARAIAGIYGGLGLLGAFGIGGTGDEIETSCANLGAASCSTPEPIGGGLYGYFGYTFDPVGFELFLAGYGDTTDQKATYTGAPVGGSGGSLVPASAPARTESFTFVRGGGMAAIRARATFQNHLLRGTFAGGVGVSYREIVMNRTATDSGGDSSTLPPRGVGYVSPAISAEGALHIRVSPTFALAIGVQLLADNASITGSNTLPALPATPFGSSGAFINNPQYHVATGPQISLGPFLGVAFGP
ncbi:MAG: PEGA domain-containing protein [Polyangiaceae bacterium]